MHPMNRFSKFVLLGLALAPFGFSQSYAHGDKAHAPVEKAAADQEVEAQYFIRVESGFRIEGPSVIKLKRGDQVEVDFVADSADELHLHGYDITVELVPNKVSRLSFHAKYAGRFGFELHENDREIGVFEIHP